MQLRRLRLCLVIVVGASCAHSCSDDSEADQSSGAANSGPAPACSSVASGVRETSLTAGGASRDVRIFVPPGTTEPRPVVLVWHGFGDTVTDIVVYAGFEEAASLRGMIVVHPSGLPTPVFPDIGSGLGWEVLDAIDATERDDIAFAEGLIHELVTNWCADPDRVYSAGFSNGGMFTATLVCTLDDRLAAAVSVSGVYHPDSCEPDEPVPYLAIHGDADVFVPLHTGGRTMVPELRETVLELGASEAFALFAAGAGCDEEPVVTAVDVTTTRSDYRGCNGETPMAFTSISGGGHRWPAYGTGTILDFLEEHTRN